MAQPNSVYDPESDEQSIPQSALDVQDDLPRAAGDASDPRGAYDPQRTPKGDSSDPRGDLLGKEHGAGKGGKSDGGIPDLTPTGIASSEAAAADSSFKFNPTNKSQRGNPKTVIAAAGKHKKGMLFGGLGAAGIIGLIVVVFLMLIPLKIEHIVNNLERRFFSTSENAVKKETEYMMSRYIKKHVLPAITQCGSGTTMVIHRGCNPSFGSVTNPVDALYKGWSDNRLENKLASRYGIEFKAIKRGSVTHYYMKAPGLPGGDGQDITDLLSGSRADGNLFQQMNKAQVRQAVRAATENETRWKRVMYRMKMGRLLEEKYGIRRCLVYCGKVDAIGEYRDKKINAARVLIAQRVISPRNESLGIVIECLFSTSCNPEETEVTTADDGSSGELAGSPENPDTDSRIRSKLSELALSHGISSPDAIDKMVADYKTISDKGYKQYVLDKVLEKAGLQELSSQITDAVPVIGWINSAMTVINRLHAIGPAIKKLSYVTNAAGAVSLYMAYRSYADEIHTGHVDVGQVGSFVDSLGPGKDSATDPVVGGTASAEGAPLYASLMGEERASGTSTSLLNSILPGKAYAVSASSIPDGTYLCNDKKPPTDKVCPEEKLGGGNALFNSLTSTLDTPPLSYITAIAGAWTGVFGAITGFLGNLASGVLNSIPGISEVLSSATAFASSVAQPFLTFVANQLILNPFSTNMGGGRNFTMTAAGADVAGADYAHTGLGGKELQPAEVANIVNEQQTEAKQQFESQSVFARMFNTDSQYSLISKVAMDIPFSFQTSTATSFASIISSPMSTITQGFGALFTGKANAAVTAQEDPFNVPQYGYTAADIPEDPGAYWDAHCSDNASQAYQNDQEYQATGGGHGWNGEASDGPKSEKNGMPVNTKTNPCMLIKATVGSAGGIYDQSLLTSDDLADLEGAGSGGGSASDSASVTIDMNHLYDDSTNIACAPGTKDLGIVDGYHSRQKVKIRVCAMDDVRETGTLSDVPGANGKLVINSRLSAFYVNLVADAKAAGVRDITAAEGFRSMARQTCLYEGRCGPADSPAPPGTSNHQMGIAVDWSAAMVTYLKSHPHGLKSLVANDPEHWSPTGT